ncbi:MAG: type I-F CRISPR-associated endonuclease Cas1 [Methyloprofundus sp.]|nr:type I-F CRISPR-associated endonuclease Cas1 [Methyloprofundus sp.]
MEQLTDLKAILHSKRANIYYLEKCRVMQKDGRVLYLTEDKLEKQYWNIPIANTTVILLGTGTSITQAAVRMLASAGVLVGFCGGGGTPLLMANDIEWMTPQSEYRPTEYFQGWMKFWFQDNKRLEVAKRFQEQRLSYMKKVWKGDRDLNAQGFYSDDQMIEKAINQYQTNIDGVLSVTELLTSEARFTKQLYAYAAQKTKLQSFTRNFEAEDLANGFLNHGNYLAYGLAATTLWVLGLPHGFAVMHGKTRRGALVFDVADLIKDTLILPWAFICAQEQATEQEFRQQCLQNFTKHKAMEFMFDTVKQMSLEGEHL